MRPIPPPQAMQTADPRGLLPPPSKKRLPAKELRAGMVIRPTGGKYVIDRIDYTGGLHGHPYGWLTNITTGEWLEINFGYNPQATYVVWDALS
jgi:hypothetical protein